MRSGPPIFCSRAAQAELKIARASAAIRTEGDWWWAREEPEAVTVLAVVKPRAREGAASKQRELCLRTAEAGEGKGEGESSLLRARAEERRRGDAMEEEGC